MKIVRPNMADLSRTFASSGESDSKEPPITSIDLPPTITPIMEFCRPLNRAAAGGSIPEDQSASIHLSNSIAAGAGAVSTPIILLRRGVWRISLQAAFQCTGAAPVANNYFLMAMVGPAAVFEMGLVLLQPALNGSVNGAVEFVVHLPSDEWGISLEVSDPVTALAVNRYRGSAYACHLL